MRFIRLIIDTRHKGLETPVHCNWDHPCHSHTYKKKWQEFHLLSSWIAPISDFLLRIVSYALVSTNNRIKVSIAATLLYIGV